MVITTYLAPINKFNNIAFRELCLEYGADFVFTEMINIDKLIDVDESQINKTQTCKNSQEKTIFQVICKDISLIRTGINKIIEILGFKPYEINYNMGCPQSTLTKDETGVGILKNIKKVEKVLDELSKIQSETGIIMSIKTRLGISENSFIADKIINLCIEKNINKIYFHCRYADQSYTKPAKIDKMISFINSENKHKNKIDIIINGDINSMEKIHYLKSKNINSCMIGRWALKNPVIFRQIKDIKNKHENILSDKERINIIIRFIELSLKYNICFSSAKTNIFYLTKDMFDSCIVRAKINDSKTYDEIIEILKQI